MQIAQITEAQITVTNVIVEAAMDTMTPAKRDQAEVAWLRCTWEEIVDEALDILGVEDIEIHYIP